MATSTFSDSDNLPNSGPRLDSASQHLRLTTNYRVENCYCTTSVMFAEDRTEPLVPLTVIP